MSLICTKVLLWLTNQNLDHPEHFWCNVRNWGALPPYPPGYAPGPSDWTDVGREFHSLEAFKKNELWNNAVRHDVSWTFITWRREWLLRSRKSLGIRVGKNVGHAPRRILWKTNKMWQFRPRCRGDIESSFRIFKCEVVCMQPRISLTAVVCTFSRR